MMEEPTPEGGIDLANLANVLRTEYDAASQYRDTLHTL